MRIKNKEIRSRRHRKEQKQKGAAREVRALYANKAPTAPKPAAKPATRKAAPKKKEA